MMTRSTRQSFPPLYESAIWSGLWPQRHQRSFQAANKGAADTAVDVPISPQGVLGNLHRHPQLRLDISQDVGLGFLGQESVNLGSQLEADVAEGAWGRGGGVLQVGRPGGVAVAQLRFRRGRRTAVGGGVLEHGGGGAWAMP